MALERVGKAVAGSDAGGTGSLFSLLKNIGSDLLSQGRRIPEDIGILFSLAETELASGLNDDKKYLVSQPLAATARLRSGNANWLRACRLSVSSSWLHPFQVVPRPPWI